MALIYKPTKKAKNHRTLHLEITDLDHQGQGIARSQGKVWFVENALPNEQVEAQILEEKKQYGKASVLRYLHYSTQRIEAKCQYFGQCGGCQMQHIPIQLQREVKQTMLAQRLLRLFPRADLAPMLINEESWYYRRRVKLSITLNGKDKRPTLGFRQRKTNDIVAIEHCWVLEPELSALLVPLQTMLTHWQQVTRLGHIELVKADNGIALLLRHIGQLSEVDNQRLRQFAHQYQLMLFVQSQENHIEQWLGEKPYYQLNDLRLFFDIRDFIQVNRHLNQKMVETALQWLTLTTQDEVLDLFCGMGNFTLPIAAKVKRAVGIEGVLPMVEKATYNATYNQLNNVAFYQADLSQTLPVQQWGEGRFNKVLLDPPRSGADFILPHIATLQPEKILYISCNPATLLRDAEILLQMGYSLEKSAMIDMFPHTGHLESINLFYK